MKPKLLFYAGLALLSCTLPASSQTSTDAVSVAVEVLSEVEITDTAGGSVIERRPLDVATPNETVIYKITIENGELQSVNNVILNIPVSESLLIKPDTLISDLDIIATFTTGAGFRPFSDLLGAPDGATPGVAPGDVTAIRIEIPELPREEVFFVEYDAVVK